MRRSETLLLGGFAVVSVVVGILAASASPRDITDARMSTLLHGPNGASALARTLEGLGVRVERRKRPLYGLKPDSHAILAVLRPTNLLDATDQEVVRDQLLEGGRVFLLGNTGLEECLGVRWSLPEKRDSGAAYVLPPGVDSLGTPERVWTIDTSLKRRVRGQGDCVIPEPVRVESLLTWAGAPVAVRLHYATGGSVIISAEARYGNNRDMRNNDAALLIVPWLIEPRPRRIIVDEYHHGFGGGQTLFGAAWRWLLATPAGPILLQLLATALLALLVAARRFGPPVPVISYRRRSPMEHLDALAIGLARSRDPRESVRLIVRGLRRRLGSRESVDESQWLGSLKMAAVDAAALDAVGRLSAAVAVPDKEQAVLSTALAAEDVWNALKRTRPNGS